MLAALLASGAAHADPITTSEIGLESTYSALHIADWMQTSSMVGDQRWIENNPILGRNPSRRRVNLYFASTLAAHVIALKLLPARYRPWLLAITIGIEAGAVARNAHFGIRIKF